MYRNINIEELRLNKPLNYYYFIDAQHPLAIGKAGWVYYHRHLASIKVNRWISSEEIVHHINHNKLDNNFSNLEIMTRSEHARLHNPSKLQEIICRNCGEAFIPSRITTLYCSTDCLHLDRIIHKDITKEWLEPLIWEFGYTGLKPLLGMSDKGIKKMAIRLGCITPPPYFHQKYADKVVRISKYLEIT